MRDSGRGNVRETRTIVTTIRPKLIDESSEPLRSRPTDSPEAYELYLRASERLSRIDRWDTRTAIEVLKDATAIGPEYADAWGRLSVACAQMIHAHDPDLRWYQQAEDAIDRALSVDPTNADALQAQGRILWSPARGFQNQQALRAIGKAAESGSHDRR